MSLLRQYEVQLIDLEQRESVAQATISALREELSAAKENAKRRETRTSLAEREVGFLQTLLASYDAEASAEVSNEDKTDHARSERIKQLEMLLQEYKAIIGHSEKQVAGLGAGLSMLSSSSNELSKEVEKEHSERVTLQRGKQKSSSSSFVL